MMSYQNILVGMPAIVYRPELDLMDRTVHLSYIQQRCLALTGRFANPGTLGFTFVATFDGSDSPTRLRDRVGNCRFRRTDGEVEIELDISIHLIQNPSEDGFRRSFADLIMHGVEKFEQYASKSKAFRIEEGLARRVWAKIIEQYLAEALPLQPPVKIATEPVERPTEVEYYFYFRKRQRASSFAKELEAEALSIEISESDGKWLSLVIDNSRSTPSQDLVSKLTKLAEAHGGEYDGWSA